MRWLDEIMAQHFEGIPDDLDLEEDRYTGPAPATDRLIRETLREMRGKQRTRPTDGQADE